MYTVQCIRCTYRTVVYIYIYIYIYTNTYTHTNIHTHTYTHTHTYIYKYTDYLYSLKLQTNPISIFTFKCTTLNIFIFNRCPISTTTNLHLP